MFLRGIMAVWLGRLPEFHAKLIMKTTPSKLAAPSALAACRRYLIAAALLPSSLCLWAAGPDLFMHQPAQARSVGGELRTDLVIEYHDFMLNGKKARLRAYNGAFPGPTLRAKPGETMHVRYINKLPPNEHPPFVGSNSPHDFNSVNLHTHGLNVSPEGFSDNVLLEIDPGQWIPARFDIPADHPTGLYWYHPHKHGSVTVQLGSGMAGNLILEGPGDLTDIPEIKAAKTLEMIFSELPLNAVGDHFEVPEHPLANFLSDILIYTINGLPVQEQDFVPGLPPLTQPELPEIHMVPGEVQRWQFTHAGLNPFLRLAINNVNTNAPGLPFQLLSYDAITLPAAETRTSVFVGAGNRVEMLVRAGGAGSYTLASIPTPPPGVPVDDAHWRSVRTTPIPFARVIVSGRPTNMAIPTTLNPPLSRLPDITDAEVKIPGTQVNRHRTITFDVTEPSPNTPHEGVRMTINQRTFDGDRIDQTMILNTAEEWTLATDMASAHPFHIHVNWFQVLEVNGTPLPFPRWQDTVTIPQGGTVKIRHRFQHFTGKFVLHCHILPHEDSGMMALLEVINPEDYILGTRDSDDPEGDGYPNIFHEAFGFQPMSNGRPTPSGIPAFAWQRASSNSPPTAFSLTFDRRTDTDAHLRYILEASPDLHNWFPVSPVPVGPAPNKPGFETVRFESPIPAALPGAAGRAFLRFRVARPDFTPLPLTPEMGGPGHGGDPGPHGPGH